MDLSTTLKTFLYDGNAVWENIEFSTTLKITDESNKSFDLQDFFEVLAKLGVNFNQINTFVYKNEDIESVEGCISDGFPLSFEDDISSSTSCLSKSKGLDIESIQTFLSFLLNSDPELVTKMMPAMIFCNGNLNKELVYLFVLESYTDNTAKHLRSVNNNSILPISVKTVSCEGPLPSKKWLEKINDQNSSSFNEVLDIEEYVCNLAFSSSIWHENGISSKSSHMVKSIANYDLFHENDSSLYLLNQPKKTANISLEVICSEVNGLFSSDSSHITSITANVTPLPGNLRSPALPFFQDLNIIAGLLEGFGSETNIRWAEYECSNEQDSLPVHSIVVIKQNIKTVFDSFGEYSTVSHDNEDEDDDNQIINLISPRQELDITEKLWDVLKLIQNYQDLCTCLAMISSELKLRKSEQFWLHEDGESLLAEMIKSSYKGETMPLKINGLLPLQILIEIGLDKLKRDYVNFFMTNRISTLSRLQPFIDFQSEIDVTQRLKSRFIGLQKLHHVVELSAFCHLYLQLPMLAIHKIVRSALNDYSKSDIDFSKTFTFPVSYKDVKVHLNTSSPSLWRIEASGITETGKCTGTACWTTFFPFSGLYDVTAPSFYEDSNLTQNDELPDELTLYYRTTVTEAIYPLMFGV